ncbi:acyltransferase [Flavobacterium sp. J27]|uniref:acyltransferase n=1 Tax=Flavobacterium sp. J27 TaxID=2060419 RepID=UPI00102F95C3|nr:acyltransferase [Flavobacterium sp. J27]
MKLSEYVKKRNGVPFGHPNSLRNNLKRSLGASNFSTFWNFWNPIFGYYLGTKIFRPLKKILPIELSIVITFVFCGLIHDFVTSLLRGEMALFFSVWFLIMGVVVVLSKLVNYDLSHQKWIIRAFVNLFIIGFCFLATSLLNLMFNFH